MFFLGGGLIAVSSLKTKNRMGSNNTALLCWRQYLDLFQSLRSLFFFLFFKCLGVWTQDLKHTDHVLYHWATPIASRNINKQLVFPGTLLDSEDRNWYILVVVGLTVSSDFSETRSPIYFITKNGCPPPFFRAFKAVVLKLGLQPNLGVGRCWMTLS